MNNLNSSIDEVVECPLCMEPLEVDDLNFFPCTCGYQICRFCWHRIRTDENELCPACRKEYPENPADFKPLTQEEMIAFKSQKRQRDQQRKQKITENRKHLANVRVVQKNLVFVVGLPPRLADADKNLVFVVGLPPRLADADILKKHEYFGKYGKIHKVVINPSTTYAGIQGPSASAYVTYVHNTDALRAIQSVNNITIDGRLIKTSLGTTKYCSHFMKNQQCPKSDCMYLHELGDPEASFTKEEMHQGKHQEYEKRLHEVLIASSTSNSNGHNSAATNLKNLENGRLNNAPSLITSSSCLVTTSMAGPSFTSASTAASVVATVHQKDAWPSLSVSPVTTRESSLSLGVNSNNNNNGKNKKDRSKPEKSKNDKVVKIKHKSSNSNNSANVNANSTGKDTDTSVSSSSASHGDDSYSPSDGKSKSDKNKDKHHNTTSNRQILRKEDSLCYSNENDAKANDYTKYGMGHNSVNKQHKQSASKNDDQRSLSSSSGSSSSSSSNESSISANESISGKSSPGDFIENNSHNRQTCSSTEKDGKIFSDALPTNKKENVSDESNNKISQFTTDNNIMLTNNVLDSEKIENNINKGSNAKENNDNANRIKPLNHNSSDGTLNLVKNDFPLEDFSKLSLFDGNSFFSSGVGGFQQSLLLKNNKLVDETALPIQINQANPHLPDLINGIDVYQNNTLNTNDLQNVTNSLLTGCERQTNLPSQQQLQHQMLQQQNSNDNSFHNSLFGTNMSKFFDFHKNQQQKMQSCLNNAGVSINGNPSLCDNMHMMSLLENSRTHSQLFDAN
uniref:CCR4-NOT transcription complex subunit 4 n=1 Tax=Glossina palpalis gambiensis TaxID=67801 RepID=A0A1B0BD21_9MUSC